MDSDSGGFLPIKQAELEERIRKASASESLDKCIRLTVTAPESCPESEDKSGGTGTLEAINRIVFLNLLMQGGREVPPETPL